MKENSVQEIIRDFQKGKCVIIVDSENRENEGDIVCAGEKITPEIINFMAKEGRGLICVPISQKIATRFSLTRMVKKNTELHKCNFTVSIDYKHDTSTGISASDRAKTVQALTREQTKPEDFARPGHIFPLIAHKDGFKKRHGHTEAAVYLTKLANMKETAVICEILKDDGEMARRKDLELFAKKHRLKMINIERLVEYEEISL